MHRIKQQRFVLRQLPDMQHVSSLTLDADLLESE